mgnify:CR=1 FL=1
MNETTATTIPDGRGGARPGSGRPKGRTRANICVSLPRELDAALRAEAKLLKMPVSRRIADILGEHLK